MQFTTPLSESSQHSHLMGSWLPLIEHCPPSSFPRNYLNSPIICTPWPAEDWRYFFIFALGCESVPGVSYSWMGVRLEIPRTVRPRSEMGSWRRRQKQEEQEELIWLGRYHCVGRWEGGDRDTSEWHQNNSGLLVSKTDLPQQKSLENTEIYISVVGFLSEVHIWF